MLDYFLLYVLNGKFYTFLTVFIVLAAMTFPFFTLGGEKQTKVKLLITTFVLFIFCLSYFQFNYTLKNEDITKLLKNNQINEDILNRAIENMYDNLEMSDIRDYKNIDDGKLTYSKLSVAISELKKVSVSGSVDYTKEFVEAREKSLKNIYELEDFLDSSK